MKTITIRTSADLEKASKSLSRLTSKTNTMTNKIVRDVGRRLENELRDSALQAGITPFESHNLDISWEQDKNSNSGRLSMSEHLVFLDGFKGVHWVNVTRNRPKLLRWALLKGRMSHRKQAVLVQGGLKEKFAIGVTPKPFIQRGFQRTTRAIPNIIRSKTKEVIKDV